MGQPDAALPEIYLLPGESHLVSKPMILRTVLGSCVGIAFFVPRLGLGALCHPMLPVYPLKPPADLSVAAGRRYVDFAIRDLASQFDSLGVRRHEVRVKVFGGGDVLLVANAASRPTVGALNCEAALRVLPVGQQLVDRAELRDIAHPVTDDEASERRGGRVGQVAEHAERVPGADGSGCHAQDTKSAVPNGEILVCDARHRLADTSLTWDDPDAQVTGRSAGRMAASCPGAAHPRARAVARKASGPAIPCVHAGSCRPAVASRTARPQPRA